MQQKLDSGLYRAMHIFVCVVNCGSFTAAAEVSNLTVSQVSRIVTDLEKRLGIQLLHRSTRNLSVTDSGKWYFNKCKFILDFNLQTEQSIRDSHSGLRGKIKITSMKNFGSHYIYPLITEFNRRFPMIEIEYHESQYLPDMVSEGINSSLYLNVRLPDSLLKSKTLGKVYSILCASPEYIAKNEEVKGPEYLDKYSLLSIKNPTASPNWELYSQSASYKLRPINIITSTSPELILHSAIESRGIALLPIYTVIESIRKGDLIQILPEWRSNEVNVYLMSPPGDYLDEIQKKWNEFISAKLPKIISKDYQCF